MSFVLFGGLSLVINEVFGDDLLGNQLLRATLSDHLASLFNNGSSATVHNVNHGV